MEDAWEVLHFGDLSHDGSADTDNDGYSDYWEFINNKEYPDPGIDPNDGTTQNEPPLEGYNTATDIRVTPPAPEWTLDIDGNGVADPLTDGYLMYRYLMGFSEDRLTESE